MKCKFLIIAISFGILAVSCKTEEEPKDPIPNLETVTFDTVALVDGVCKTRTFSSHGMTFENRYNTEFMSWSGFACSSRTDTQTSGYTNDLSVYNVAAASGSQFAVVNYSAYDGESICMFTDAVPREVRSLKVTNGTYPYLSMKKGDDFAKKLAAGDWFKLTVTGYNGAQKTQAVDFYLADFRDGKTFLCDDWTTVDIASLGSVTKLAFTFDGSDKGQFGLNTPAYACIDDIVYEE